MDPVIPTRTYPFFFPTVVENHLPFLSVQIVPEESDSVRRRSRFLRFLGSVGWSGWEAFSRRQGSAPWLILWTTVLLRDDRSTAGGFGGQILPPLEVLFTGFPRWSAPPLILYCDPFNIGIWITKHLTLRIEITPFTNQTQAYQANHIDFAPIRWEIEAPWVPHQTSHGQPQIPSRCISFWIQVGSLYYSDLFHRTTHIKRPTNNSLCCLRRHFLLRNGADIIPTLHIKGPNLPRSFQMRFSYPIKLVISPHYQSNPWCPDGILKLIASFFWKFIPKVMVR
jgi:hypothetical protein